MPACGAFGATLVVVGVGLLMLLPGGALALGSRNVTSPGLTCSDYLPDNVVQFNVNSIDSFIENNTSFTLPATRTTTIGETEALFGSLCSSASFSSLLASTGIRHVTLEYQLDRGGFRFANFTLSWMTSTNGSQLMHNVYWSGNLQTGVVSGPFFMVGPAVSASYSYTQSSWAGYEFWWPSGSGQATLWENSAYTQVVSMTNPGISTQKNVPHGTTVDAMGAAWVGLTTVPQGSTGIWQTGYVYDASNPSSVICTGAANGCNNGLWYEYWPTYNMIAYSGAPHVATGDWLKESVYNANSGYWGASVYDYTTSQTWTASLYIGSWSPLYGQGIMEAPKENNHVQQIAQFSAGPVNFEYGDLQTGSSCRQTCVPWDSFYNQGTYDQYQMSQENLVQNVNANHVNCQSYLGNYQTSCYQETWYSSAYDYTFV